MAADRYSDGRYRAAHPDWHQGRAGWKAAQVIAILRRLGIEPSSVCDIGCGTGLVLAEVAGALPTVVRAVGFEPSSDAPFHPEALSRVELRRSGPDGSNERFDLALVLDVFEHVPDYLGFLGQCRHVADQFVFHVPIEISALGVISGRLGNSRSSNGHLHHFTARTALQSLDDVGYRVVATTFTRSGWEGPERNPWSALNIGRRMFARASPSFASRLLGGLSLLVAAEPR